MGMFPSEPTSLEAVVTQAAHDLKVSGFGQRVRASLRRNKAAGENTVIPDHFSRSFPGPDLVRHLNGLLLMHLTENPDGNDDHHVDRELYNALQNSLQIARHVVASFWVGPLRDVAPAFVDEDNLPLPLCPMYPEARELVAEGEIALPHQLTKIINRVRVEVEKTPVWTRAAEAAAELTSQNLQTLKTEKERLRRQVSGKQGETLNQWQERAFHALAIAKSHVPPVLLFANRLITATVAAMISLATWDYQIKEEEILECDPLSFGDDLPHGFVIRLGDFSNLVFLSLDSSFRLFDNGTFAGIATTKGAEFSWGRDSGEDVRLSIIRLSAYESPITDPNS